MKTPVILGLAVICGTVTTLGAQSDDYQLGLGLKVSPNLTVGGYFSAEYGKGDDVEFLKVDDLAVLAYGNIGADFSYLVELESVDFYVKDMENGTSESNLPPAIERLYGDYKFSDYLAVRAGKFITPIGYWNLQPINVLRETTSNPRYSREMFPKFVTGVDFYGYTPFSEKLSYHFFAQGSTDLDDEYVNIPVDQHLGFSLEKSVSESTQWGGSIGTFRGLDRSRTNYIQLNGKWAYENFRLQAEGMLNAIKPQVGPSTQISSAYVQGEYSFSPQHVGVARLEHLKDDRQPSSESITVLGYSYRPVYPVSLKVEYQWHSDSRNNLLLSSFSVLF